MPELLGLGLDNIFTMKCWSSCLIIAQYYSSLLGNCHYHADQVGRLAYRDAMAWHFTLTGRCLSLSSTSEHCVRISVIAITDTGNLWKACVWWRVGDLYSMTAAVGGPLWGPASQGSSGHYLPAVCRCVCPLPTQTIKSGCQPGAIYGLLQKNNTAI